MLRKNNVKLLLALAAIMLALGALPAQAARNDGLASDFGGFGAGGTVASAPLAIHDMVLQRDGMIVAAGVRDNTFAVARFLASGALDASFGAGGLVVAQVSDGQRRAEAAGVVVQPDGRLVVAGTVYGPDGRREFGVVRLTGSGALDASFSGDGRLSVAPPGGGGASALALDRDGRIVVGGSALVGARSGFAALRLLSGGTLDAGFAQGGLATVDFGGDALAADLLIQPTGEIVLAGQATVDPKGAGLVTILALARLGAKGLLDPTFDGDGMLLTNITDDDRAGSVTLDRDDKIVVSGTGAGSLLHVVRYYPSGTLDDSFDRDGIVSTPVDGAGGGASVARTLPGNAVAAAVRSGGRTVLARYDAGGAPDAAFGEGGRTAVDLALGAPSLLPTPDGRLVVAGGRALARLLGDGAPDAGGRQLASFRPDGGPSAAFVLLAQPDGKAISLGTHDFLSSAEKIALVRHLPDGQLDPSFGAGGAQVLSRPALSNRVSDALLQPGDGKILFTGVYQPDAQAGRRMLIGRVNPDGTPDAACGNGGLQDIDVGSGQGSSGRVVELQADGKILVAGTIDYPVGPRAFVLRVGPDCATPDPTFGRGGLVEFAEASQVTRLLALPDGLIELVGTTPAGGVLLARLNGADGARDMSFGVGGVAVTPLQNGEARAAVLLPDGKLLVAARDVVGGQSTGLLLRYTAGGTLDSAFGVGGMVAVDLGRNRAPTALALRADGAFALAGDLVFQRDQPVALFSADGVLDAAFGEGGIALLSIGGPTRVLDATFSGSRLLVAGDVIAAGTRTTMLAAYPTGGVRSLSFAPISAPVPEGAATALLTVRLSQTAAQTVTVSYAATGGSATNGVDYTLAPGTLRFAPGQTAKSITVPLAVDRVTETDETVVVTLSQPGNAVLGPGSSLTLTIADGDLPLPANGQGVFLPLVRR